MTTAAVREWIRDHSRAISLDSDGPLPTLPLSLSTARIVAVASPVRSARELVRATHTVLRSLVVESGFRAVMIEGVDDVAAALDRYVRTGDGDPATLLASGQRFVQFREVLSILTWMRRWNREHPHDQLSIVHDHGAGARSLPEVERMLAGRDLDWHAATGQRIVHCGGTAHLVIGDPRFVPPDQTHTNAGGLLRRELGTGFGVLALTVGSGTAPFPVPPPPPDFVEHDFAGLAGLDAGASLLDLAGVADGPPSVRDWARRPVVTRMIGPAYDAARDHDARIEAAPLTDALDVIVHVPRFRAATPLDAGDPA